MPNHVTNWVAIKGEPDQITDLKAKALKFNDEGQQYLDFNAIIPMPADVLATTGQGLSMDDMEKTKGRNWYDWSVTNWGTKWNAYSFELLNGELPDVLVVQFDTAWASPTPIFVALEQQGFKVNCFWSDEGGPTGEYGDPWECFDIDTSPRVTYINSNKLSQA